MGTLAFVMTNSLETATLSVDSEDTDYPGTNLICRRQSKRYHGTGAGAEIIWELPEAAAHDCLALCNHDCVTSTATFGTLSFSNTSTLHWETNRKYLPVATGDVPQDTLFIYDVATAYKYYRLQLACSGTVKIGELIHGDVYNMTEMYAYGARQQRDGGSLIYQTDYGTVWAQSLADVKPDGRRRYFSFPHKTATGLAQYETVMSFADGGARPLLMIDDYGESDASARLVHLLSSYSLTQNAPAVYSYALETLDQPRHGEIG
jgi:hypothetical protein